MTKVNISKKELIERFDKGARVVTCCGLWNDPRTRGEEAKSVSDIESMFHWASMIEIKQYDGDDTYYVHGYSDCDMF